MGLAARILRTRRPHSPPRYDVLRSTVVLRSTDRAHHDDEDTHAILIVDENEGNTENETQRERERERAKPQKAKTTIETRRRRKEEDEQDEQVQQDVEPKNQNTCNRQF